MESVCDKFSDLMISHVNIQNTKKTNWSFEKSRLNNFRNIKKFEYNDVKFLKEHCVKLQCTFPRF